MPLSALSDPEAGLAATPSAEDPRLTAHLRAYLGGWPPSRPIEVIASDVRYQPAWDGARVPVVAVASPVGTVVSVPPDLRAAIEPVAASTDRDALASQIRTAVDSLGRVSPWVSLRWTTRPADLPDEGIWVDSDHPALPKWLGAFPGPVLAVFDHSGRYLAGVGIKRHTPWGHELAVGTAEHARGRGLARRLVAQAARVVLEGGAIPLYVHDTANEPSARVADAAGFPDEGWRLLVVWS